MAPVGDAVGFVDRDKDRLAARQQLRKARDTQALRSNIEKVQLAGEIAGAHSTGLGTGTTRMDALGPQPETAELLHLILHQRDERRDHQSGAAEG
jgi:hypothetical protein